MSTSFSRSATSMATRNVIGWSFPSTLPTWAKPRSESPRETRSTRALSTRNVSERASGPKRRAIEAASFAGGAAGFWAVKRSSVSAITTSELIADAQAQHVILAHAGRVAHQLIVSLEGDVPRRLVRQAHRGDPPRERWVARHAGRDVGLRVVALVTSERAQPLRGRRSEQVQYDVRTLEITAGNATPDRLPEHRVDGFGVADTDVGDDTPQGQRPEVEARVRRQQRDRSRERPRPDGGVGDGRAAVPERPADLQARARPLEPPGKRWVREAGILTLLATLANPLDRVEPLGLEPVHEVHSVRDRKSTRLNSSHRTSSYAVFCLKKKNIHKHDLCLLLEGELDAERDRLVRGARAVGGDHDPVHRLSS